VYPTVLRFRDGRRQPVNLFDASESVRDLYDSLNNPVSSESRTLRLRTPDGATLDVMARDILQLEIEPPYCLIPNFLPPQELDFATAHAKAHEAEFESAVLSLAEDGDKKSTSDYRFRRSRVLNNVAAVAPMVVQRLHTVLPHLWQPLAMTPMAFTGVECQMTAHGDGDFFNTHTDNGLPDIAHRYLSYVYYFHREPKQFTGGALRLYKTVIGEGAVKPGDKVIDIDPPRNGLMVFPSWIQHEVTPISCASAALLDQRLTINGWLVSQAG